MIHRFEASVLIWLESASSHDRVGLASHTPATFTQ
jgi:hypothetical protein